MIDQTRRGTARLLPVVAVYAIASLPLVGVATARAVADVPTRVLLGDPAQTLSAPFYVGAVSNIGNALWVIAATACLFAAAIVGRRATGPGWGPFLRASGVVSAWLALDDMLLIHDEFLVDVIGVREPVTFALYGVVFTAYAWHFRERLLAGPERPLVLSALGLLATSVLIDLPKLALPLTGILEDGAKFLGIAGWSAAMVAFSLRGVREAIETYSRRSPPTGPRDLVAQ